MDGYESSEALMVSSKSSDHEWILDSSCSFHMTPNRMYFEEFQKLEGGSMLLGSNQSCKITGIGAVRFKFHDGTERLLKDVRHVPDLKRNLISFGELDKGGYVFRGENGILKITSGSMVVMRGIKKMVFIL